jgi:2-iminobutanoate/2-iminopropanoate deaminase
VNRRDINAPAAPMASGGYSQAVAVVNNARTLYVSGQIPQSRDGAVPATFREQCLLAWRNLEAQLLAADMTLDNVVKVTTYLSDRRFGFENGELRREILGDRTPALTVIIAAIFDDSWLLEIEAIAAD